MSGEATARSTPSAVAFERAFGSSAICNRCARRAEAYRVIATFLHDTVAVRAYCDGCYPEAVEGQYQARGDGLVTDYDGYARRFGAPGPPPPPMTPVDRILSALVRDPALRLLSPASEVLARRSRAVPYRFRVELSVDGWSRSAELALAPDGRVVAVEGEPSACERIRALLPKS